ncbi:hypothetical protein H0H92_010682 [Tricholoma furcatifolium]|nr:hypothetical protein H0H92_010682 [Tricholoma furcatifolium]
MGRTPKRKRFTSPKKKKSSVTTKTVTAPTARRTRQSDTLFTPPPSTPPRVSRSTEAPNSKNPDAFLDDDDEDFWNPPASPESPNCQNDDTPPLSGQTTPSTPTTADRVRITRKNAVYNKVIGAMRGSQALEISRSRPLRSPIDDVAANTRRFNRIITDIIMRCERLGEETGCWLLFLGQLPSSKALTHYASSRLRREAKAETINVINQYQALIRSLLAAKRSEAVTIQKRFDEVQKDLDHAQQELALKEAELARYRAMHNLGI